MVSLDGTFALDNITSAIIPEGVVNMANNTFNSTGIKYLYLPSTLEDFRGWSYFHNGEKLFFGGTEDQWSQLYTGQRSSLDFVQIICNADPDALPES